MELWSYWEQEMLRASDYNIVIHNVDWGHSIVINGLSGSLDAVNLEIARLLDNDDSVQLSLDSLPDAGIKYLVFRGYLTDRNAGDEVCHAKSIAEKYETYELQRRPIFYLMITYDCQLACDYCFERDIRNQLGGRDSANCVISPQCTVAAFDAMDIIESRPGIKTCTLYGGEPLLPENKAAIIRVINEADKRGYGLVAASNGVDIHNYTEYLGPHAIAGLHVTLHGAQVLHDKKRVGKRCEPTFQRILNNLRTAMERGVRIKVRINADQEVIDHLNVLVGEFYQAGFLDSALFSYYIKAIFPARRCGALVLPSATDFDVALHLAKNGHLARIFSSYPVIHDRIDSLFEGRLKDAMRSSHCGAPSGQIVIFDPIGRIFPCNNIVGEIDHQVGTYYPTLSWNDKNRRTWAARTVRRMPKVNQCKYGFFCGGGCLYDAQVRHGAIGEVSCQCCEFSGLFRALVIANYNKILKNNEFSKDIYSSHTLRYHNMV